MRRREPGPIRPDEAAGLILIIGLGAIAGALLASIVWAAVLLLT